MALPKRLHRIVSESEHEEQDEQPVTLSGPQMNTLRRLSHRLSRRIVDQKKALRRAVTGSEHRRVRDHAATQVARGGTAVKKQVRKAVTGSSERAIRDWAKDVQVVKSIDKFSFVLGVSTLLITEYWHVSSSGVDVG